MTDTIHISLLRCFSLVNMRHHLFWRPNYKTMTKITFVSTCGTMFYSCKTHSAYLQDFGINFTPYDSTAARVRVLKEGLERLSLTLSLPCRMLNNAQPNPQNNPPWTRDPTALYCEECECTCGTRLAFREVAAASPADRYDGSFQQHGCSSSFWIY